MTHKNIFLSLFVLANIGSLFSMEKPIFTNKPARPMKPIGKLYPKNLGDRRKDVQVRKNRLKEKQKFILYTINEEIGTKNTRVNDSKQNRKHKSNHF
jgi:ABC-type microcin C transport system permease subunit YejE